jgi:hypothetical protein
VAYTGVRRFAPGLAYFPAVSLSIGERAALNFGDAPMRQGLTLVHFSAQFEPFLIQSTP